MKVSDMFAAWSDHRPVCRGEGTRRREAVQTARLDLETWALPWAGSSCSLLLPRTQVLHL